MSGCTHATCFEIVRGLIAAQLRTIPLAERERLLLDALAMSMRPAEPATAEAVIAEEQIG